ncbi:MAG: hypothetical protein GKR94_02840 [Gammaproteobacteria bacterium]|nr:hypothetical protein [Gammaproteobacteria bacterium]
MTGATTLAEEPALLEPLHTAYRQAPAGSRTGGSRLAMSDVAAAIASYPHGAVPQPLPGMPALVCLR